MQTRYKGNFVPGFYLTLDSGESYNFQNDENIQQPDLADFTHQINVQVVSQLKSKSRIFCKGSFAISTEIYNFLQDGFQVSKGRYEANPNISGLNFETKIRRNINHKSCSTIEKGSFKVRIRSKPDLKYINVNKKECSIIQAPEFAFKFFKEDVIED